MNVGELLQKDRSKIGQLAVQLASAALSEFGRAKGPTAATKAANRIHSILQKGIDDYFFQAGMRKVSESVETGKKLKELSHDIFKMAEETAFDASSEGKQPVHGDQVWKEAKVLIASIKDAVSDYVHQGYSK